jgi:murein L,D-transpeptidase YcbB/YkuD
VVGKALGHATPILISEMEYIVFRPYWNPPPGILRKEIIQHVKGYADKGFVSKHALLLKVKFVEAIDKTSVGKTNKVALRQKHL